MSQKTMKALVLEEAFHLNLKDVPLPEVPPGYARVKMLAISICGSDIHAYRGNSLLLTYPRVLGHELCGVIDEINGAPGDLKVGDESVCFPIFPAEAVSPAGSTVRTVVPASRCWASMWKAVSRNMSLFRLKICSRFLRQCLPRLPH